MKIRQAFASDCDTLVALHKECFDTPWPQEVLAPFIASAHVWLLGNPVEAFIIIRQTLDEAEVITLAVAAAARHRGIGSALLAAAFAKLSDCGATRLFLEVAVDNSAALALYHKAGFKKVGLRRAYYARPSGPSIDAIVMSRALNGTLIVSDN